MRNPTAVTIVEDTREQRPFTSWPEWVAVERRTLDTGDYSIAGYEDSFAVERKSLDDFAGTMLDGYEANSQRPRKRFNNELERLRHFDVKAVVVTATPREAIDYKFHSGKPACGALWGFAHRIFASYGVPVHFLGDEPTAARWIADLARKYVEERRKRNRDTERRTAAAAESTETIPPEF